MLGACPSHAESWSSATSDSHVCLMEPGFGEANWGIGEERTEHQDRLLGRRQCFRVLSRCHLAHAALLVAAISTVAAASPAIPGRSLSNSGSVLPGSVSGAEEVGPLDRNVAPPAAEPKPPAIPPNPGGSPSAPPPAAAGDPNGTAKTTASVPALPSQPRPAPSFTLPDIHGTLVNSAYSSREITMVHFWASWCVPCMREIPVINRLAASYEPAGAAIFAVAMSSGEAGDLRQLARAYDVRHTILLGTEELGSKFGGIPSFPTTFLVDRRGRIRATFSGASEEVQKGLEAKLRAILETPETKKPASGRTGP